jgi:predicted amidophosphoribosyltransferase
MCVKCQGYLDTEYQYCPYCGESLKEFKVTLFKEQYLELCKKFNMVIKFTTNEEYVIKEFNKTDISTIQEMYYSKR